MIKGIAGKPYIDLDQYLDIDGFINLHPEICKGMALTREFAKEGTWTVPGFEQSTGSYMWNWKPIYKAFNEYLSLPEDHPIKIQGKDIFPNNFKDYKQRNIFTRYLKLTMGASDPYIYYFLWEEGEWDNKGTSKNKTEIAKFFPGTVEWVESLIANNIFSEIGRVIFFVCDHDLQPFEHRDVVKNSDNTLVPSNTFTAHNNEFIHIRPRTKRGFYLWDPDKQNKVYINSYASFWNDQDWHGGEVLKTQEYSMRIDGKFTTDFKQKLNIHHIEHY